jgi:hypothetical protein
VVRSSPFLFVPSIAELKRNNDARDRSGQRKKHVAIRKAIEAIIETQDLAGVLVEIALDPIASNADRIASVKELFNRLEGRAQENVKLVVQESTGPKLDLSRASDQDLLDLKARILALKAAT